MEYFATGFGLILGIILLIFILISCLMWFFVPFWIRSIKNSLKSTPIDKIPNNRDLLAKILIELEILNKNLKNLQYLPH